MVIADVDERTGDGELNRYIMNEHLKPVFEILLPVLENSSIDYWVFGGVSIAAYKNEFFRKNKDVDIFVKEIDFQKTKLLLEKFCSKNIFKTIYSLPKNINDKPKLNILLNKEIMSVIPVYQKNNKILFKYRDNNEEYSIQILERVKRNINGYKFFTPKDKFIKEMFINHIKSRQDKKIKSYFIEDANVVLTREEFKKYMI